MPQVVIAEARREALNLTAGFRMARSIAHGQLTPVLTRQARSQPDRGQAYEPPPLVKPAARSAAEHVVCA